MRKWGLRFLRAFYVGLIALLPAAAIANYTATQGAGTNVGSIVIAGVHFFSNLVCDFATANQCATVSAANALKVDGSAVTQPVSLTSTTITGTVAATQSGTWTVQPGNTANTTAWLQNMGQMGGTTISASCVSNYGTTPGAVACPSMNAFVTNSTTAIPNNADAIAVQAGAANSPVNNYNYVFNGTTWDRGRSGTTTGSFLVNGAGTAGTAAGGVLTIQGVAAMTKLLVTPDSVALPANQSVNVAQFGGVSTSTGQVAVSVAPVTATNTALVVDLRPDSPGIIALGPAADTAAVPNVLTPTGNSNSGITPIVGGSAASSLVLKASAGSLYNAYAECTAACWLMVFNSTTAPSNGATTAGTASGNMVECIPIASGGTGSINYNPGPPEVFSVGITATISSTTCATLTLATTGFIHGMVK